MSTKSNRGGNLRARDEQSMHDEVLSDKFREMRVALARHNLEVTLKRTKEQCFRAAKEIALKRAKEARQMNAFVRSQYSDEPRKMAEWDEIMQKYEFVSEEDEE
jgi:hypothetical protein